MLKRTMPDTPDTLGLKEAADQLGLHYMTVYRYVRTGRLPASRDGLVWRVRALDVKALQVAQLPPSLRRSGSMVAEQSKEALEARLLAGDGSGAWWLIEERLGAGMDPAEVLTGLLSPAIRSIGSRWAEGDLTVADEHRATAVAQRIIGRLGFRFGRPGHTRGTVVLTSPAGDLHMLPVAIVADLLRWRGFEVVELGANTPADALVNSLGSVDRLVAVGIASTTTGLDEEIIRTVKAVRARCPDATVLLGGSAIRSAAHSRQLGADIWTGKEGSTVVEVVESCADKAPVGWSTGE